MAQVKIFWKGDHGEVIPSNFQAKHEEAVSWTATGSAAAVKFTNKDVFGMDELIIGEGMTETVKVMPKAYARAVKDHLERGIDIRVAPPLARDNRPDAVF